MAKRAQLYAANLANGVTPTVATNEICGYNEWNAPTIVDAKNEQKATDYWYAKGTNYIWTTNIYQPTARDFTNLIWRSSTKVGFGIVGKKVVALYCETKGNVKGRFNCNVCKKNIGCDATKCPLPNAVCSSEDGQGNAEFSLSTNKQDIRIIATVKKG